MDDHHPRACNPVLKQAVFGGMTLRIWNTARIQTVDPSNKKCTQM